MLWLARWIWNRISDWFTGLEILDFFGFKSAVVALLGTIVGGIAAFVGGLGWVHILGFSIGGALIVLGCVIAWQNWLFGRSKVNVSLDVLFDHCAPPYKQEWDVMGDKQTLYRIGIRNRNIRPIVDDVVVKIEEMLPWAVDYLPATLRLMNSDATVRQFSLCLGETRYVDVLQRSYPGKPGKELVLWHTVEWRDGWIPLQDYKIKLLIVATGIDPIEKVLKVTAQPGIFLLEVAS